MPRAAAVPFVCMLAAGCAAPAAPVQLGADHPASPQAEEAPLPRASTLTLPTATPTGAAHVELYVCPMHADVTSATPGTCPRCGMTLVPHTHGPGAEGQR